jgi:hypothetical protein
MRFRPPNESSRYSIDQIEAALCIWEELNRRTLETESARYSDLAQWREDHGTYALRHAAIGLVNYVEAVYQALPPEEWDGLAYDWEIVPAVLNWVSWLGAEPVPLLATEPEVANALMLSLRRRSGPLAPYR